VWLWDVRIEQRTAVLGQQPIHAALGQLITHQQHHVIESALPGQRITAGN
jgi:hypothetical protein